MAEDKVTSRHRKKVLEFIQSGFFDRPKEARDVKVEFRRNNIHYTLDQVRHTLFYMARTGELVDVGDGRPRMYQSPQACGK